VEEDIKFYRELVKLILENVDAGIHVTDREGKTIYYNKVSAEIDGISETEAYGKHVLELFPSLKEETSTILQVLKTGKPVYKKEQQIYNLYGQRVYLLSNTLPIIIDGEIKGAVDISRNLTAVKKLAERVVDLQQEINSFKGSTRGVEQARYTFSDIIGEDPKILALKARAQKVARTDSPILVYGETGTGKELLVQAIHNLSPQSKGPFVSQNCAALPATLMESILFGTVKGSFTGAENRPGLVELADGGTLFLDEINSMDVELQTKLLRFLQEGYIRRIGDSQIKRVKVRVIASTNMEPLLAVEKGILRRDLYYRLNVVTLTIPPLRERKGDILLLTEHFIKEFNRKFATTVKGISAEVEKLFLEYDWPGNVRELRGVIEGALNLVEGDWIEVWHLPDHLMPKALNHGGDGAVFLGDFEGLSLNDAVAMVERKMIQKALEKSGQNISKAAKILGIPRQTLQYKIKELLKK